jgi:hypothetical protein
MAVIEHLLRHRVFQALISSRSRPRKPATSLAGHSRGLRPREIERCQDHEEGGHKTENEFYYTDRLFTLRFPPPSNMPRTIRGSLRWLSVVEPLGSSIPYFLYRLP